MSGTASVPSLSGTDARHSSTKERGLELYWRRTDVEYARPKQSCAVLTGAYICTTRTKQRCVTEGAKGTGWKFGNCDANGLRWGLWSALQ
eukprot:19574-Rhodomonas_salina.1